MGDLGRLQVDQYEAFHQVIVEYQVYVVVLGIGDDVLLALYEGIALPISIRNFWRWVMMALSSSLSEKLMSRDKPRNSVTIGDLMNMAGESAYPL